MFTKEIVGPKHMIEAATDSALLPPFPQYAAKTSAYPSVKAWEGANIGVLEIFKPAFDRTFRDKPAIKLILL